MWVEEREPGPRSWKANGLRRKELFVRSSSNAGVTFWEKWIPDKSSKSPSLSDVLWPSAGAFAAMAILGKIDQILAPKGISMTIAPLGAVCAVLFATPMTPGARVSLFGIHGKFSIKLYLDLRKEFEK
ncbi:UNVERIFIED_CONTAM: hypothetical protein Sradi_4777400 [Sesamum radiatum]|uniref:HPP transmembrane region domain-containing protein n=1 Tax=Sesamum radiatum TaxID=300843 RepID=A0AAW2MV87_SESRA